MGQALNETEARRHAKLALEMFNEGLGFVGKGDIVQASEKLYKAVEKAVKALAIARGLDEAREALSRGRWTVSYWIRLRIDWEMLHGGLGMLHIFFMLMVFMRLGLTLMRSELEYRLYKA